MKCQKIVEAHADVLKLLFLPRQHSKPPSILSLISQKTKETNKHSHLMSCNQRKFGI